MFSEQQLIGFCLFSGASVCNQYEDEDDDDLTGTREKVEENDKTKEKMATLRTKMENMAINKKVKSLHSFHG